MLSHTFYNLLHVFGIMLLFSALGATVAAAAVGDAGQQLRKLGGMTHGVALLIILVGGSGMLARLGLSGGWPLWVWLKLVIWLLLGAAVVVARKIGARGAWLVVVLPILGAVSAWLALFRVGGG